MIATRTFSSSTPLLLRRSAATALRPLPRRRASSTIIMAAGPTSTEPATSDEAIRVVQRQVRWGGREERSEEIAEEKRGPLLGSSGRRYASASTPISRLALPAPP